MYYNVKLNVIVPSTFNGAPLNIVGVDARFNIPASR